MGVASLSMCGLRLGKPHEGFFQLTYVNLIRTQTEGFVHLLTCYCSTKSITYNESFTYLLTYLRIVSMPTCDICTYCTLSHL